MFLTDAEIVTLTGYHIHAKQREWLDLNGWTFAQSHSGRPIVGKAYADQRLGLSTSPAPQKRAWTPNLAAFAKRA